ncbi:xyloglucanase [Allorhizocola rhizosphaerae]|uniref:xyloglucanase n=1 Tax=Allorhizocola rhizosphaerae TaxID=1872709 RepID=UPI001B8AA6DB|nr:xyloglucanase [Allorhizocola rhizosphaerae]
MPRSDPYVWRNVRIGGGGFVTGIVCNPSRPNLIYARTDIGGMYRWEESTQSWIPLLDWVGWDNWGYQGVASVATDPIDPDRVYAAVGMYTNDWDPNNGAILRSVDRGDTWEISPLPFKLGANMPGRGMGERLAIDPNHNAILYLGAPNGNGLWRSTDSGASWARVAGFPGSGDYAPDPSDPERYLSQRIGVVWVAFDASTGGEGHATQGIYVGVADPANPVYHSTDGGVTWSAIPGAPAEYLPHKGIVDSVNRVLYIATSDTAGPYDGAKGDVWRYDIATTAWTRISPIPSSSPDCYFGYSGLTLDRQNPETIMVTTQVSWWPDAIFFRSTDGGASWTGIWEWATYSERTVRYTMDISSIPWLTFGEESDPPATSPKLGWMTAALEIDPFNPNRMMYGTGATIYGTNNLTDWDSGGTVIITPMVNGLEQTAVIDLISPPSGPPLISALGDVGGFRHDDLERVPSTIFTGPVFTTTRSLDYAESNPGVIVRAGDFTDRPSDCHIAFSTDGGATWFQHTEPRGISLGGSVAVSADGRRFVWAPGDPGQPVVFSAGFGMPWAQSTGVPPNAVVRSDRVNPHTFYAFKDGTFFVSANGGATFQATAATGLPAEGSVYFKAVPGHEGDIWLAGGSPVGAYGMWRSTDSGASFTRLSNVERADNVGFGKAPPARTYPAVYAVAQIGGVRGFFRSDDGGAGWARINDDQHQYGNACCAITGDPRIYGRVYVTGNGRGIVYGDRSLSPWGT